MEHVRRGRVLIKCVLITRPGFPQKEVPALHILRKRHVEDTSYVREDLHLLVRQPVEVPVVRLQRVCNAMLAISIYMRWLLGPHFLSRTRKAFLLILFINGAP